MEARTDGTTMRGTLYTVGEQFLRSECFREPAAATLRDYRIYVAIVKARPIGSMQVDKLEVRHGQRLVDEGRGRAAQTPVAPRRDFRRR